MYATQMHTRAMPAQQRTQANQPNQLTTHTHTHGHTNICANICITSVVCMCVCVCENTYTHHTHTHTHTHKHKVHNIHSTISHTIFKVLRSVYILEFPHETVGGPHRSTGGPMEILLTCVEPDLLQHSLVLLLNTLVPSYVFMVAKQCQNKNSQND